MSHCRILCVIVQEWQTFSFCFDVVLSGVRVWQQDAATEILIRARISQEKDKANIVTEVRKDGRLSKENNKKGYSHLASVKHKIVDIFALKKGPIIFLWIE